MGLGGGSWVCNVEGCKAFVAIRPGCAGRLDIVAWLGRILKHLQASMAYHFQD